MNTQASRQRRSERIDDDAQHTQYAQTTPAPSTEISRAVPDPWLFDTEELIKALDKIRETICRIPLANHEVHLRTLAAVDETWRLREHLRELLRLRGEMQTTWRAKTQDSEGNRAPSRPKKAVRETEEKRHVRRAQFTGGTAF